MFGAGREQYVSLQSNSRIVTINASLFNVNSLSVPCVVSLVQDKIKSSFKLKYSSIEKFLEPAFWLIQRNHWMERTTYKVFRPTI